MIQQKIHLNTNFCFARTWKLLEFKVFETFILRNQQLSTRPNHIFKLKDMLLSFQSQFVNCFTCAIIIWNNLQSLLEQMLNRYHAIMYEIYSIEFFYELYSLNDINNFIKIPFVKLELHFASHEYSLYHFE